MWFPTIWYMCETGNHICLAPTILEYGPTGSTLPPIFHLLLILLADSAPSGIIYSTGKTEHVTVSSPGKEGQSSLACDNVRAHTTAVKQV